MKRVIALLTICIIASCTKKPNAHALQSTKIIVVHDLTDSFILTPLPDPILSLYDFKNNKSQEASLEYVLITNKKLDPGKRIHLDDEETSQQNNSTDDVHYRDKLIQAFYTTTRKTFAEFPGQFSNGQTLDRSECFCTIMLQLRKLAASQYRQKCLIVFSDLTENTSTLNAYSDAGRRQIQSDPKAVGKLLSQRCDIPDNLKGITIFFVFQPRTREESERFLDMASIYQILLEKRGAKLMFQANNDSFKYE